MAKRSATAARAVAVCAVAACALALFLAIGGYAGLSWADDGDGSNAAGRVVDVSDEDNASSASSSSSSSTSGTRLSTRSASADQDAAQTDDATDGSSSSAGSGATALDADGNVVDEGQVADSAFLDDAKIGDLNSANSYYDGQAVRITGEVVGEAINADTDDTVWITLYDSESDSSISVYMKKSELHKIDTFGGYGKTGTLLSVHGTFNLSCEEHGSVSDVHAQTVTVSAPGSTKEQEPTIEMFEPALIAVAIGGFLLLVYMRLRERTL